MDGHLHFFPTGFPDETLHSLISRYARLCGFRCSQAAFAGMKSAPAFSQNVALPSRLADLADVLPNGTELSIAELIEHHTLLPYYAPFLSRSQLDQARTSMAGDGRALMLTVGVNASRIGFASRVRCCAECIAQDQSEWGVAYWHRVHLLPGVLVCPYHGTLLRILDHRWSSRNSRYLNLPSDDSVQTHTVSLDIQSRYLLALKDIALRSQQVLESGVSALPACAVRYALVQGAAKLGLASETDRLHLQLLAKHIGESFAAFPSEWEFRVLGESREDMPAEWVIKLLRKPRASHHPLKFILLASALRVEMDRLLHVGCVEPDSASISKPHIRLPESVPSLAASNGQEGSVTAVWKHAMMGTDVRTIAAIAGVSLAYVYRCIRNVAGGPALWREARFQAELREKRAVFEADYCNYKAHACRGYAWLYRCDRHWLSQCTSSSSARRAPRTNSAQMFAALDLRLARDILLCANALSALPGKPVRISRTRIGRELHVLSRFDKQLSKLPLCRTALEKACESAEAFRDRRLQWARCKLLSEGRPFSKSSLYRVASIRPSTQTADSCERLIPSASSYVDTGCSN
ncbi:TnsD family Tn7-like transposition protein [Pseudomonas fitomaticsae]